MDIKKTRDLTDDEFELIQIDEDDSKRIKGIKMIAQKLVMINSELYNLRTKDPRVLKAEEDIGSILRLINDGILEPSVCPELLKLKAVVERLENNNENNN
jgi:hypothetical protein